MELLPRTLCHTGGVGIAVSALGAALILYGVVGLSGMRFDVSAGLEPWLSPIVGVTTGLVTGATGVFVIPAVPYLQSLGLEKEDLVQALGLSFTVSTVALAAGLFRRVFHGNVGFYATFPKCEFMLVLVLL